MKKSIVYPLFLLLAALSWSCVDTTATAPAERIDAAAVADSPSSSISAERMEILRIAEFYATHEWQATEANIFHGETAPGVRVDTPDVAHSRNGWSTNGTVNLGLPYKWGGFSSIEEFERGIAEGKYAGDVHCREVSPDAVGLDCSGFVSRCWGLETKRSTRSLGAICVELDSFQDMLPGDAINKYDSHVRLFEKFLDPEKTRVRVYESTTRSGGKVQQNDYTVQELIDAGYSPLRYQKLIEP
jgi:hypothetical protein